MKKTIILTTAGLFMSLFSLRAQETCAEDSVAYVNSKNTGVTGGYMLTIGGEEKASQAYHYSGPGRVGGARVYGTVPSGLGVSLKVSIYNIDANDRPTGSALASSPCKSFYPWNGTAFDFSFSPAVTVDANFAIVVELVNSSEFGHHFELQYTGNGEGLGEDLASLAGTSTGSNWASAMADFGKDGDFYLYPRMINFNTPNFTIPAVCVNTGSSINFTNTTEITTDRMFNLISSTGYSGEDSLYTWDFGDGSAVSHAKNPSHIYSTPGAYTVTLTSVLAGWNSNCSRIFSKVISVGLAATASSILPVTCFGGENGSIVAGGTGGSNPYMFSLDGESYQNENSFLGLAAGNYILRTKDLLGCIKTTSFAVTQPAPIQFTTATSTNASCGSSDGGILVATSGGVGAILYQLNGGAFQTSGAFINLPFGGYLITAKDANECTSANVVLVNDIGGPTFSVVNSTDVSCHGGHDGSINLSSLGGTGTIQYSINGGLTYQTSGVFTNVYAGKYTIIVKDAAGCSDVRKLAITQPQQLSLAASTVALTCFESEDGQINVHSVTGGTGATTYSLTGISFQSGTNFPGLTSGTYTVYARDVAGCVNSVSIDVFQPTVLSATITTENTTCSDSQDGAITIVGVGGTPGYTFAIDGDERTQNSGVFTNLAGNETYTLVVNDANGCIYTTTKTINQPTKVQPITTTTNSTCGNSNGGILATATGGFGSGYTFSIDGGAFGIGSFPNLQAGVYVITAKDGRDCSSTINATIFDSDGPVILTGNHTNVLCNSGHDGSITVGSVSGGTGGLQYSINGTTYQTSPIFNNLPSGLYDVIVKDAVGCIGDTNILITQPNAFIINTVISEVLCNASATGVAQVLVGGGSGTLAFSINDGVTYQSSNIFNNLFAGSYTFIVKDAGGCLGEASAIVHQPHGIFATYSVLNIFCSGQNNGILNIHAAGGTGTLEFSLDGIHYQASNEFHDLNGGAYTIYIRDENGCVYTKPATIFEPEVLSLDAAVTNVTCAGGNNGVIDVSVSGGSPSYDYSWSNDVTTEDNFNLVAGTYTLEATDGHGCTVSMAFIITEPLVPVIVNGTITNANTPTSGAIDVTVTGGGGEYTFVWSNGSILEDLTGISAGVYTVVITDNNGCSASSTFVVANSAGLNEVNSTNTDITVYPNPTNDFLQIDGNGSSIDKVEVVDVLGQIIYVNKFNDSHVKINTSAIVEGVYFINIYTDGKVVTRRVRILE